jgi:hypothetical protein
VRLALSGTSKPVPFRPRVASSLWRAFRTT